MKLKPMKGRLLIKELPAEERTSRGGLILPDSADRSLMRGEILSNGPVTEGYVLTDFLPGTKVLFVEYSSAEVEFGDKKFRFIRYEDVIGIYDL